MTNWNYIKELLIFIIFGYIIGIGSILYGALSGKSYGNYLMIFGIFILIMAIYRAAKKSMDKRSYYRYG